MFSSLRKQQNIEDLHKLTIGYPESFVYSNKKAEWPKFEYDVVKETRTFSFIATKTKKTFTHTISDKCVNEAYTNLQITMPLKEITLEINNGIIEHLVLFNFLGKTPNLSSMSEGNAIPSLDVPINIVFTAEKEGVYIISYDVVTPINYIWSLCYQRFIVQEEYSGPRTLSESTVNNIKLDFKIPIIKLYLFLQIEDVEDVRFNMNNIDLGLTFSKKEDYYILEFGEKTSINFGRVDNQIIKIVTKKSHPGAIVNIVGVGRNVLRIMIKRAVLAYNFKPFFI